MPNENNAPSPQPQPGIPPPVVATPASPQPQPGNPRPVVANPPPPQPQPGNPPPVVATPANGHAEPDNGWPVLKLEPGDLESYQALNDSIHIFEWLALKHYASGGDVKARKEKGAVISEMVNDLKKALVGAGCPPGYTAVGGACIRNPA